jgi:glycine betaine/proline transport system substrate-binding protein
LTKFEYTTEDQQEIAFLVDAQRVPIRAAAERWIRENPDVWRPWLS